MLIADDDSSEALLNFNDAASEYSVNGKGVDGCEYNDDVGDVDNEITSGGDTGGYSSTSLQLETGPAG